MKKRLLFVIESLSLGGAEKSLVSLLNILDYSRFDVDLLLFAQGGEFQPLLPKEVRLLELPEYFAYNSIAWSEFVKKIRHPKWMLAQLGYSIALRSGEFNNTQKAVLLWRHCKSCLAVMTRDYDCAIAYAQGLPTFFVAEKVKAGKKAAWINIPYQPEGKYLDYIKPVYSGFDFVNAVSSSVAEQIQAVLDIPDSKLLVMRDILDVDFALKMAAMPNNAALEMAGQGTKILTVGRLAKVKGYDLAIDAAKLLLDMGLEFTWYVLGEGGWRRELEKQIKAKGLGERFILLGARVNPYPYFAACDIYVQPSRFEGFGIALAEAKMFNKPIVACRFDTVSLQLVNEQNGLIVESSAPDIANAIVRLLSDRRLREHCINSLASEEIGNCDEIEKLYKMLDM